MDGRTATRTRLAMSCWLGRSEVDQKLSGLLTLPAAALAERVWAIDPSARIGLEAHAERLGQALDRPHRAIRAANVLQQLGSRLRARAGSRCRYSSRRSCCGWLAEGGRSRATPRSERCSRPKRNSCWSWRGHAGEPRIGKGVGRNTDRRRWGGCFHCGSGQRTSSSGA